MLAYPLPTWAWPQPMAAHAEPRPMVSALLGKLHSHLQRNLEIAGYELGNMSGASGVAPAIQVLGESVSIAPAVRQCVAVRHRSRQMLTVVRTAQNEMTLDSWRVNADGSIIWTGTSGPQTERVAQIALARAAKYVVAYRTDTQRLKLVSWDVSNTGAIYRAGESDPWPEPVRKVTLCALNDETVVTACIMRDRRLKLITWRLGADATVAPLRTLEAGDEAVRSVEITSLSTQGNALHFATVLRTAAGQLVTQVWQVTPDGGLVGRGQAVLAQPGSQPQAMTQAQSYLITAIRTVAGETRLLSWRWRGSEAPPELVDEIAVRAGGVAEDEPARRISIMPAAGGVITAIQTRQGRVQLARWEIRPDGAFQRGVESALRPVAAGPLALCPDLLDGNAPILTGLKTTRGLYKLTSWRI